MSWTLWQRLPPRYQLTAKEVIEDSDSAPSTPRSPRTPRGRRVRTPRSRGGSPPAKVTDQQASKGQGQATMYFTVTSPRDIQPGQEMDIRMQQAFPVRRSSFVNSFKQQQRINSARQTFQDPSTATPRSLLQSSPRARTAPSFPITRLESHETQCVKQPRQPVQVKNNAAPTAHTVPRTPRARYQSKSAGANRQTQLSINMFVPFDKVKPFVKNPLYPDHQGRRYILRNADNTAFYIDSDKVVFTNKGKNGQSFAEQDEGASYLAHLRRLYLKEPKDLAKFVKPQAKVQEKKKLIRERLEYDKKTDHILNYYSRADDIQNARAWTHSITSTRRQNTPASARASSSRDRRHAFPPSSPRRSAGKGRSHSARYSQEHSSEDQAQHSDALEDWNMFLKINSRSTLHERKFYLQTPANLPAAKDADEECSCRLCKLEMEVAVIRQQQGSDAVFLPQENNADENAVSTPHVPLPARCDKHDVSTQLAEADLHIDLTNGISPDNDGEMEEHHKDGGKSEEGRNEENKNNEHKNGLGHDEELCDGEHDHVESHDGALRQVKSHGPETCNSLALTANLLKQNGNIVTTEGTSSDYGTVPTDEIIGKITSITIETGIVVKTETAHETSLSDTGIVPTTKTGDEIALVETSIALTTQASDKTEHDMRELSDESSRMNSLGERLNADTETHEEHVDDFSLLKESPQTEQDQGAESCDVTTPSLKDGELNQSDVPEQSGGAQMTEQSSECKDSTMYADTRREDKMSRESDPGGNIELTV